MAYSQQEQTLLLDLAKQAIACGLNNQDDLKLNLNDFSDKLKQERASFVTLEINHRLRGCIGSLQPHQALIKDVASNAYKAAFKDPRFPKVTLQEFEKLTYHISVLNLPEPMNFVSEQDLLNQLRPNVDGLIITDGIHRATFLPQVWESLTTPQEFLRQLKLKAGLTQEHWSSDFQAARYTVESIK